MPNIHTLSEDSFGDDSDTYQVNYHHGHRLASLAMPIDPQDAGAQLRNLIPYNKNPNFTFSRPSLESIHSPSNDEPTYSRKKSRVPPRMNDDEQLCSPLIKVRREGQEREERAQRLVAKYARQPPPTTDVQHTTSRNPKDRKKKTPLTRAGAEKAYQPPSRPAPTPPKPHPGRPSEQSKAAKETALPVRRSARIVAKEKKKANGE